MAATFAVDDPVTPRTDNPAICAMSPTVTLFAPMAVTPVEFIVTSPETAFDTQLLGAMAILCVVLDSTRIFALLSWPLVLLLLPGMIEEGARRDELRKTFLACAMAAVVFPPLMVWSGKVFSSANFVFADRLITAAQDSEPVFPDNYKMYNDLYK